MDFNAAIFDLDGTILDSMDVWEHIDIQFLKKRNLPVPENYVTEICARSFEEAAQYTIDLFGLQETVEGIIEEWNNMAVEEYSNHVGQRQRCPIAARQTAQQIAVLAVVRPEQLRQIVRRLAGVQF